MRSTLAAIVAAALSVGVLFGYVASVTTVTGAYLTRTSVTVLDCPAEDSCTYDYTHGKGVVWLDLP